MGGLHCGGAPEGAAGSADDGGEPRVISSAVEQEPHVAAAVAAPDGSRYLVGTFSGSLRAGEIVLRSRGGVDIYLAHRLADGDVEWAIDVGGKGEESSPRISLDEGNLKLVAMTTDAVDCGNGPLRSFDTETFFVCTFDRRGTALSGGAFPTGRR